VRGLDAAAEIAGVVQVGRIVDRRDEVEAAIGSVRIKVGEEFPEVLDTLGCERLNGNIVIEVQDPQTAIFRLHIHRNLMEPVLVFGQHPGDAAYGEDVAGRGHRSGRVREWWRLAPVPWQEFMQARSRMIGDPGEYVGEPGARIDIIEFCCGDQRIHRCCALSPAIAAGEEPGLAAKSNTTQSAFRGIVGQANATIVEKPGKGFPALEHVVHRLRHFGVARELATLSAHPLFERGNQWCDPDLSDGMPFARCETIDIALGIEHRVDPGAPPRLPAVLWRRRRAQTASFSRGSSMRLR